MSAPEPAGDSTRSIILALAVLAVVFWTVTAQGQRYMAPGGLRGEHAEKNIACVQCHLALLGTPDAKCLVCHKGVGVEQAQRQGRHAGMIGACYRCHIMHQSAGVGTTIDRSGIDHSLVGFTLDKHETQTCGDCHAPELKLRGDRINGRCARCHAQPEQTMGKSNPSTLELQGKAADFAGHRQKAGDACLRCHIGGAQESFKHASDIQGAHLQLECARCHQGGQYTGLNWTCATCHKNPHKATIGEDCLKCHNQNRWSETTMKHDTGEDCAGCHAPPAGHFAGACNQCHKTTQNWQAQFNHPGMPEHSYKSFPCDYCHPAGGSAVDCRRCHKSVYPRGD